MVRAGDRLGESAGQVDLRAAAARRARPRPGGAREQHRHSGCPALTRNEHRIEVTRIQPVPWSRCLTSIRPSHRHFGVIATEVMLDPMLDSAPILAPSAAEVCHIHDGSAPRCSHAASKHSGLAAGSCTQTVEPAPMRAYDGVVGGGEFQRLNRPRAAGRRARAGQDRAADMW
jgi:hypothetical protein